MSRDQAGNYPLFAEQYLASSERWRGIDPDWLGYTGRITLNQEKDINNQSLVLAIELVDTGRVLLFPADAQELSWRSWHDLSWSVLRG